MGWKIYMIPTKSIGILSEPPKYNTNVDASKLKVDVIALIKIIFSQ